ncbi:MULTISPECIES: hypothetical protein [Arsenicicoccus]|uniref:hypothetical protein n=1 Tax=Arsenicicoccus TaxID=267408 RepID=UPI000492E9A9|nr:MULTISPECIES: hypothetical protein [Arsenicicoccus]
MTDELTAELQQMKARELAEYGRIFLFAGGHPEALRDVADPSIALSTQRSPGQVWALPAGWVRIVNELHHDLLELLGEYVVTRADQKAGRLCYDIAPPSFSDAVQHRIAGAEDESRHTCELCGVNTSKTSIYAARCTRHATGAGHRIIGAIARPPGESERLKAADP